jgi:hypothetical protein
MFCNTRKPPARISQLEKADQGYAYLLMVLGLVVLSLALSNHLLALGTTVVVAGTGCFMDPELEFFNFF